MSYRLLFKEVARVKPMLDRGQQFLLIMCNILPNTAEIKRYTELTIDLILWIGSNILPLPSEKEKEKELKLALEPIIKDFMEKATSKIADHLSERGLEEEEIGDMWEAGLALFPAKTYLQQFREGNDESWNKILPFASILRDWVKSELGKKIKVLLREIDFRTLAQEVMSTHEKDLDKFQSLITQNTDTDAD